MIYKAAIKVYTGPSRYTKKNENTQKIIYDGKRKHEYITRGMKTGYGLGWNTYP